MMNFIIEIIKEHIGKSITIANLATIVLVFWAADKFYFNIKYCLASEARQTEQTVSMFVENEYRRNIMLLELKPRAEWTIEENAQYGWYKQKLNEHLKNHGKPIE